MPVSQTTQQAIDKALASRDAARTADQAHVQALGDMEKAEANEKQVAQANIDAHKLALEDATACITAMQAELDTGQPTPSPTPPTPTPTPTPTPAPSPGPTPTPGPMPGPTPPVP